MPTFSDRSRRFRVPDAVARRIRNLHPDIRRKIRAGFDAIQSDPFAGKALREELAGLFSLRVSRFRIVYRIASSGRIEIVAVGPRRMIYEETRRLLQR